MSREALLAGLPITGGRLSIALYQRAAARAGLEVEVFKRKISDIPSLVLPAILIMRDGTTRILQEVNSDARLAKVIDPSNASNAKPVTLGSQAADYVGFAFLVRPKVVSRRSYRRRRRQSGADNGSGLSSPAAGPTTCTLPRRRYW